MGSGSANGKNVNFDLHRFGLFDKLSLHLAEWIVGECARVILMGLLRDLGGREGTSILITKETVMKKSHGSNNSLNLTK